MRCTLPLKWGYIRFRQKSFSVARMATPTDLFARIFLLFHARLSPIFTAAGLHAADDKYNRRLT